jgi:hypothetical protein
MAADAVEEVCSVGSLGASEAYSDAEALGNLIFTLSLADVLIIPDVDVGAKSVHKVAWTFIFTENNLVHTSESSYHKGALEFVAHKLALLANELVGYYRDNEEVSEGLALHEVGDMAAVEEVEDSVSEDGFHL